MKEENNRAFMYGESVFTTMVIKKGVICDRDYHFERLKRGVEFLYGPFLETEHWDQVLEARFDTKCQIGPVDKILRLTVYREGERGLWKKSLVSLSDLKLHLSISERDASIQDQSLKLRTCPCPERPEWWPDYLKAGSYLPSILAQKKYLQVGDDDVLFLSPDKLVRETSVANIFVVKNNIIYTPPTGPNVLAGVMRKKVLLYAFDYFADCIESAISLDQLYEADAVFGSNSVRGLFLVDKIDDREISWSEEFMPKFLALKERISR